MEQVGTENRGLLRKKIQKSYFDVLGLCCTSEVPVIEKILEPLDGIQKVSVVVPSKTVIVVHDTLLISQLQIVKALNQARLEASIRAYGNHKIARKWPSPYILACGLFLVVSLFHRFFRPLRWAALVAVVIGLPPIVLRSFAAIRRYTLDVNILMLIAVAGAVALRDYTEAGFIVFLFIIAEWLESTASHKATAGMSVLMSMAPQKAILAESGEVVDARDVKVNTILAVKAGEVIPIDGIVVEGRSEVDESSLTGESFPVAKQAESRVWAGTLNMDGYISVKTTKLAEESAVAKMARLVEEAQNSRSKTQRLIDSCAKYYTPAVVTVAAGVAIIPLILRVHNPKHWFQLALVLLVCACPCALVLSTPVATFCALLKAARLGLFVKGGDILEALAKTKVVAFDKTGTITQGEFRVGELLPVGCEVSKHKLLYWISSIESKSSHPLASALVDYARKNSIEPKPEDVIEFCIYPGEGVYGEIDGKKIYIGNARIAARTGSDTVPIIDDMKEAVTVGYVFADAVPIGKFTLADTCRTGAAKAIRELKSLKVKTVMLTGDSTTAAMYCQNQLGLAKEEVHAELLPKDKVRIISELKHKEGPTTMVGDGMNDAPALASANVGISMGISGSAVATETSHITLMSNDILKVPKAIRLARKTSRKIKVNILFSMITKIAILVLAIAGHPILWAAVLADVGTCLIVILNSMTLLHVRAPKAQKCCRSDGCSSDNHAHDADHCVSDGCSSDNHAYHADHCVSDGCSSENHVHQCQETVPTPVHCCSQNEHPEHEEQKNVEHFVSVGCKTEHHGVGSHKEHSENEDKKNIDGCCKGEKKEYGKSDKCHSSTVSAAGGETGGCCRSERKECKDSRGHDHVSKACRESHGCSSRRAGMERGEIDSCCKKESKQCGKGDGCSSSAAKIGRKEIGGCHNSWECHKSDACSSSSSMVWMGRREVSGCCRSYEECRMKEGCCRGGLAQLPEIVTE